MAALGGLVLAARAMAADAPATPAPEPSSAPAGSGAPVVGLRAYADPATGQLRAPTEADRLPEGAYPELRQDRRLMWVERRPDGSGAIHTEGQIVAASVVTIGSDGSVQETCATTPPADAAAGPSGTSGHERSR